MKKIGLFLSLLLSTATPTALHAEITGTVPFQNVAHEILKDSVAMRTVAGYGQVPKLVAYLKEKFIKGGFHESDIKIISSGETAALVVRYKGDGRSGKKPILLSGHMDVVQAIPEDWVTDPYSLIEENGFYFGRGVADGKFAIAVLTATLLRMKSEGYVPSRDIILVFSGGEEILLQTTRLLSTKFRYFIDAEFALIADGGGGLLAEDGHAISFTVGTAEKTYADFKVTAHNPGGHSSLPRKDNAIYDLSRALLKVDAYEFPVISSPLTLAYFKKSAPLVGGQVGEAMAAFAKNPADRKAIAVLRAQPEYVGTTGTTCVTTLLEGGHAQNALPQSASANINCRIFPGQGIKKTLETLKKIVGNDALTWEILDDPSESDASPLREDVFGTIEKAVHIRYPDLPVIPHMASGASDALFFRAAGMPSYTLSGIFIKASDEFSNGLNERVPTFNLPGALVMWHSILTDLTK